MRRRTFLQLAAMAGERLGLEGGQAQRPQAEDDGHFLLGVVEHHPDGALRFVGGVRGLLGLLLRLPAGSHRADVKRVRGVDEDGDQQQQAEVAEAVAGVAFAHGAQWYCIFVDITH